MTNSSQEVNESKEIKYASLSILNQGEFNYEPIFIREQYICNFSDTMTQGPIKLLLRSKDNKETFCKEL